MQYQLIAHITHSPSKLSDHVNAFKSTLYNMFNKYAPLKTKPVQT
jgi:hypothetical protein